MVNVAGARPPGTGLASLPSKVGKGDSGQPTVEETPCTAEGLNKHKESQHVNALTTITARVLSVRDGTYKYGRRGAN